MIDRFVKGLQNGLSVVNKIFVFLASILLVGLMITTDLDLLLRYLFRSPIVGMTEVTEIFLLYITFLGTAWVFREDAHVVVDILLYNLYTRSKKVLSITNCLLTGLMCLIFIGYGFYTTYDHYVRGTRNPTVLEMPIALAIVIIPIGSSVLFLEVLVRLWQILKEGGD